MWQLFVVNSHRIQWLDQNYVDKIKLQFSAVQCHFLKLFSCLSLVFQINTGWEKEIKHLFSHCKLLLKLSLTPQKCGWTLILTLCFSTSLHKNIQCGCMLPIASGYREISWNKIWGRMYKNSLWGNVGIPQRYVGHIFIIAEHIVLKKNPQKATRKNSTTPPKF